MIRAVVVDDEEPARRRLRTLLERDPESGIEVVAECGDGASAVEAILEEAPDLLFLDVQMPGMDGFEVLQTVGVDAVPAVVFVTAFDEHALQAFDARALDYLLKPFTGERFRETLDRVRERLARSEDESTRITQELRSLLDGIDHKELRFPVRVRGRIVVVREGELERVEASGNYVELCTASAAHLYRATLSRLERRLDGERFARVHRSHIVNLDRIRELRPRGHGEFEVLLESGVTIPASRTYATRLREWMEGTPP